MAKNRSSGKRKRKSRSYSSDSSSYSRSRSRSRSRSYSSSDPSREVLRQPPQLRGTATDEAREPPAGTQLTQKIARIEELVLQVERAEKNTEHVQKQLNDTLKKLKKAEAAQETYKTWLEALTGAATRVVTEQQGILAQREALQKLEAQGEEGREDLDMFIKETRSFLEEQEQAKKEARKRLQTQQTVGKEAVKEAAIVKPDIQRATSDTVTESQSIFRPGIKFKLNP